jgi:integrase
MPTVVARSRYRGLDGVTRQVSASGVCDSKKRTPKQVKESGEKAALAALEDKVKRLTGGTSHVNSATTVQELAELWFAGKQTEDLKYRTLERARSVLDNHVIPRIGKLKLHEATTSRLDLVVRDVIVECGKGTAVIFRSILLGIFGEALRHDALTTNPVVATRVPKRERSEIRALSLDEFLGMRRHAERMLRPFTREERLARANGDVRRMGGPNRAQTPLDVIDFLIGTGARASEVLGLCWEDVHLDGQVPWVEIRQQVIREKGRGLVLAPTKERDKRRLALPGFAVEMLTRRQGLPENEWGVVFANVRNKLMDPSNMRKTWRDLFAESEWSWVSQKTLRKTVATLIDLEMGSELAAKQLGHASDSMTKKHYIEPSKLPSDQRAALEAFGGDDDEYVA